MASIAANSITFFNSLPPCLRITLRAAFFHLAPSKSTSFITFFSIILQQLNIGVDLAPANAHDLHLAEELLEEAKGWALGDRNYWSPDLAGRLGKEGLCLLAPYQSKKREKEPWPRWLVQKRRRIETVISQMTELYRAKKVWARDRWHLISRWLRKVLSHTLAVYFCQQVGLSPLRFGDFLTD